MPKSVLVVLAFVLCVFATVMIREGPLEPPGIGERIAITLIWVADIAYIVWAVAKKSD